jgi:hypothetical protein
LRLIRSLFSTYWILEDQMDSEIDILNKSYDLAELLTRVSQEARHKEWETGPIQERETL